MAELGISLEGRAPIGELPAQARAAEEGGAGTLWIACHLFLRDPITSAAIALAATTRIKVALMAMSPFSLHPVFIAMAAATLNERFPGRVVLCLGVGAPGDLKAAGISSPRPVATLRESIALCRALFAGAPVAMAGELFRVEGRGLINGGDAIPIVLAASGPNMLELAGAAADGVLISAATSLPFVRACLERVNKSGRSVRKIGLVYTRLRASEQDAYDAIRRPLGFILRGAHHTENIRLSGASLDQPALAAAYAAESWEEVDRLVTDDVIRRHAACGTPAQIKAKLEDYSSTGLDEVIIGGIDDTAGIVAALAAARGSFSGA